MAADGLGESFIRVNNESKDPELRALRVKLEDSIRELRHDNSLELQGRSGSTKARAKLTTILGLRDSPFSERILDFFFSTGSFSVDATMEWIEAIVGREKYEYKAHFLFYMYDVKGKGSLDKSDLQSVLLQNIRENKFKFKAASLEVLTDTMFSQFAAYLEGEQVTQESFVAYCLDNTQLLDNLSVGSLAIHNWKEDIHADTPWESSTLDFQKAISAFLGRNVDRDRRQMGWPHRLRYKWKLEGAKYVILLAWALVTVLVFVLEFRRYNTDLNYELSGYSIPVAKGGGATLRLNCHLLLLPVCRTIISMLRGAFSGFSVVQYLTQETDYRRHHGPTWLWDKSIAMHKLIAIAVMLAVPLHVGGHLYNVIKVSTAADAVFMHPDYDWCCDEGSYFRRFPYLGSHPTVTRLLFLSIPGWTGWLLIFILVVMTWFARAKARKQNYERFYYTHHLLVFFYALLVTHGSTHLVAAPAFWKWSVAFCSIYAVNWALRLWSRSEAEVLEAVVDPQTKWIALKLKPKGKWSYRTGCYATICVPDISSLQYHPFTLSSSPECDHLSFHIKAAGDWTESLQTLMLRDNYPKVVVEGPYAAAAEHVFDYDVSCLFCAGIGVTPYVSVLQSLKSLREQTLNKGGKPPPNIHLYWSCRDQFSFAWFGSLFGELLKSKPKEGYQPAMSLSHQMYATDRLSLNLYMTGALPQSDVTNTLLRLTLNSVYERTNSDLVTGISGSGQTSFGRPRYEAVFEEMVSMYPGKEIGVFVCGPSSLCSTIHLLAMNKTGKRDTVFRYYKEVFQ
ncbi:superoxide-generating NADPH oxidase flavocytochrome [Diplonema papillatum]|nr:superoxide-generating NADPH oxidase flavocytochrome [Diplonema papillatum]